MAEQDIISHLIDVEHQAAGLLFDAQTEADVRTSAAREKADAAFKLAYEKMIGEFESRYSFEIKNIDGQREADFIAFKKELETQKQDTDAFSRVLSQVLFGI